MIPARQISLYATISLWAAIVGGVLYSHIVYFPPYLSHLPESNSLITGEYGLKDGNFWMTIHPLTILLTITTLMLNWKLKTRRKFILITLSIYVMAIIATAVYFVPSLIAFAVSAKSSATASELYAKGQTWQYLSWVRGFFMYLGFLMLVIALTKDKSGD